MQGSRDDTVNLRKVAAEAMGSVCEHMNSPCRFTPGVKWAPTLRVSTQLYINIPVLQEQDGLVAHSSLLFTGEQQWAGQHGAHYGSGLQRPPR